MFINRNTRQILLITNILTIIILIIIFEKEHYSSRIYHKFFHYPQHKQIAKTKAWNYSDNANYEHYTVVYSLYQKQKNIVMLGNSLTQYANWEELLNRPDVVNRGIGSDVTAGFVARLKYIKNLKPKICFIEGGINDLGHNICRDTILKNLRLIIDSLQENGIKIVLTTVTLLSEKCTWSSKNIIEQNKQIKELNEQIINLTKEKHANIIDLNQYISNENFLNPQYAVNDGIHFTDKTYLIWKHEIEKILKQEGI